MNTPICDFVKEYEKSKMLRLHMPGHKGKHYLGFESMDITEFDGADSLYEAKGIILESEKNAGSLFGADTFYSTEGSSLCIRAMLYLAILEAKKKGRPPIVMAGRNAHKTFLSAAVLLDFDISWLYGDEEESYLSCTVKPDELDKKLSSKSWKPVAVYITSPDYLGNISDIESIAKVCKKHDVLLLVDNAHGAYLKFLDKSKHPIDSGADMCCDSAHKTLPALTGGAYLHISKQAPENFKEQVKNALSLFGSTSPSYLILQSLDYINLYLSDGYKEKLREFSQKFSSFKERLIKKGFCLVGDECLKLTIQTKPYGYTGAEFAEELINQNIMTEFYDSDFVVLMFTPEQGGEELEKIENVLVNIPKKTSILKKAPDNPIPECAILPREAVFSEKEEIGVKESEGRILADINVGCPPAVPFIVCGERIDKEVIDCFLYYGIEKCIVVKH